MENMRCFECALKHTATALSYGKEILNGHGEGADLDHRWSLSEIKSFLKKKKKAK